MSNSSFDWQIGDNCAPEALEVFGEEHWLDIYETIYSIYELDLPIEVAQKLIEYERQAKLEPESGRDEYAEYLTDYYSDWETDYEARKSQ